ncbi:hypothetical protein PVAP13_1NG023972 [Panicum virgatum]|uniref:Uncharacterized protein n=1 Tax=Panicum virgatum TaxID=38727 RepID=A0A8T0WMJ4_PANVG|nr:hypothetical protein PVAP13_1NG023972 [Panicum virgatum]
MRGVARPFPCDRALPRSQDGWLAPSDPPLRDPSASSGGLCLRMRSSRSRFERCSAVISTGNSCFPIYRRGPV